MWSCPWILLVDGEIRFGWRDTFWPYLFRFIWLFWLCFCNDILQCRGFHRPVRLSLPANGGSTISSSTVGLVSSVVSLVQRTNWWNDEPKKRLPRGSVPMAWVSAFNSIGTYIFVEVVVLNIYNMKLHLNRTEMNVSQVKPCQEISCQGIHSNIIQPCLSLVPVQLQASWWSQTVRIRRPVPMKRPIHWEKHWTCSLKNLRQQLQQPTSKESMTLSNGTARSIPVW